MKIIKQLVLVLLVAIACSCITNGKRTVTVSYLLDELISYESISKYPVPFYTCKQTSSYDRRSVSPNEPGWFANDDGFGCISSDTVDGVVRQLLFDEAGPGVINRIWITTSNKHGAFKFYFDGEDEPSWVVDGYDLSKMDLPILNGLAFRHTHYKEQIDHTGGNTLYLPIPYTKHCKVVFESPEEMGRIPRYYQFNYRTYEKGTKVKTFDFDEVAKLDDKLEIVSQLLQNPLSAKEYTLGKSEHVLPNEMLSIDLPDGANAIEEIQFNVNVENDSLYASVMRKIVLKISFDGKETVWVPLSDFSGGGIGAPMVKSWYLDFDGLGNIVSRWFMPYKNSADIQIVNYNEVDVVVNVQALVNAKKWDVDNSLYFHANWKQEKSIPLSNRYDEDDLCLDWRFAEIEGRGVYVGDLLTLNNHSPEWYGEGDEKIWVDNDEFPSHFGTGTEDYYNCSWAPVVPFHTPFGGAPRADLPSSHGYNAYFRTRNLDGIPFKEKFIFDIEMLSWQPGDVDYSTTIYWYGDINSRAIGTSGLDELNQVI